MSIAAIFQETVDHLHETCNVDVRTVEGLKEVLGESSVRNEYLAKLTETFGDSDRQAQFEQLFQNTVRHLLTESSLYGISPISTLTMPMLRKAWPTVGVKEVVPTTVAKVPKFTVPFLIPYMIDPETNQKVELPKGVNKVKSSQTSVDSAMRALPLDNADVMPTGCPVSAGYALDIVFGVTKVEMSVADSAGANPETVTVAVADAFADTKTGAVQLTVRGTHSTGHVTSDSLYGRVDFENGTLTLTSMVSGAATAARAKITKVALAGRIDTSLNKRSTEIGFRNKVEEINIGTGEHFHANLPTEWLQDNMAVWQLDGVTKVIEIITQVVNQRLDHEGNDFLDAQYEFGTVSDDIVKASFDVHPTGHFTGAPSEWLLELRRVIDNLAQQLRNKTNNRKGYFVLYGNPLDIMLIPGVEWTFNAAAADELDGVEVDYSFGWSQGASRYKLVASENHEPGEIDLIFVPTAVEHETYRYYPYAFNVENAQSGYRAPGSNVPAVVVTKRHSFKRFMIMQGRIAILNNDGSSPA